MTHMTRVGCSASQESLNGTRKGWRAGVAAGFLLLALPLLAAPMPDMGGASWIWADTHGDGYATAETLATEVVYLRKVFEVSAEQLTTAPVVLTATAESSAQVWLNGKHLGSVENWKQPLVLDVRETLRPGRNVWCVQVVKSSLPKTVGGFVGKIESAGGALRVISGRDWRGSAVAPERWLDADFDDGGWPMAVSLVPAGGFPWGKNAPGLDVAWPEMPRFLVGDDPEPLKPLREILALHYMPGVTCTLWDPWMARSLLWAGFADSEIDAELRRFYTSSFLTRRITPEGYVDMHQHRGLGAPEGWPFPLWTQGPGMGWHFSLAGVPYGPELGLHRSTSIDGWELNGATADGFDELNGLRLSLTNSAATLTTPPFRAAAVVSPYVLIEWRAEGMHEDSAPYLEWTTEAQPEFSPERRLHFAPIQHADGLVTAVLPVHQFTDRKDTLTRLRIHFDNPPGAKVSIAAVFTSTENRKPITNPDFILGSADFFNWSGDINFLRSQINRLRLAMGFVLKEFGVEKNGIAYVPWVGHEGRSGVTWQGDEKVIRHGEGIGNNYFDLLPFGAHDAYLNIRIHAALRELQRIEKAVEKNPQWNLPDSPLRRSSAELGAMADRLKQNFQTKFWNPQTKRFVGAIDADGVAHDYGFTPVNMEAIVYGVASPEQAREIYTWMDGTRNVEGDTSQGADIYKWRLSPRMSTRRNIDYYAYVWSAPESIAFGDQIQDGGAVLGFSYYDIIARIQTLGPDNAWARLKAILDWYREVQAYGGYRKYYADHEGTMQGGGPPGGLGLDQEFFESGMLPSVMVYGFLGLDPHPTGLRANPRLPADWPTLSVTDIAYRSWRFDLKADAGSKTLHATVHEGDPAKLMIEVPDGWKFQID